MILKDIIKDNFVKFSHACEGILYYNVDVDGKTYEFPVDMNNKEDVGTTTFLSFYKPITLMRYIRKAIENNNLIEIKKHDSNE